MDYFSSARRFEISLDVVRFIIVECRYVKLAIQWIEDIGCSGHSSAIANGMSTSVGVQYLLFENLCGPFNRGRFGSFAYQATPSRGVIFQEL